MDVTLTKDGSKFLATLYKEYLERRKAGIDKARAKFFGGSDDIQKKLFPRERLEDIDETIRELSRARMVDADFYDDTVYRCALSDLSIAYMESKFKNGLKDVLSFLSQFIP